MIQVHYKYIYIINITAHFTRIFTIIFQEAAKSLQQGIQGEYNSLLNAGIAPNVKIAINSFS